jgi:hypothetical protein
MGVKQCAECGENVDEAKAFCPSCGHAFVEEEKRAEPSNFEKLDGTMQFGQTMYNQMLSDMGLNLKASPPPKATVQSLKPVVESIKPIAVTPAVQPQARTDIPPTQEDPKSRRKLIIISLIAAFLLLLLVVAVLIALAVWWRFG